MGCFRFPEDQRIVIENHMKTQKPSKQNEVIFNVFVLFSVDFFLHFLNANVFQWRCSFSPVQVCF